MYLVLIMIVVILYYYISTFTNAPYIRRPTTVDQLTQEYVFMPRRVKLTYLVYLMRQFPDTSMIVFTDRCRCIDTLSSPHALPLTHALYVLGGVWCCFPTHARSEPFFKSSLRYSCLFLYVNPVFIYSLFHVFMSCVHNCACSEPGAAARIVSLFVSY